MSTSTSTSTPGAGPAIHAPRPAGRRPRADAVLLPRGFVGPGRARDQHAAANAMFGPACGCKSFWWLAHESFSLGLPNTGIANYARDLDGASLDFGAGHPLAGRPRFEWFVAERVGRDWVPAGLCPDGPGDLPGMPKLGYRVPDAPSPDDPTVIASAAEHRARQVESYKTLLRVALSTPEAYEELRDRLGATDAEMEALFGHVDRIVT